MVGDEDETTRLPEGVPIHSPCGLPVELCICPDSSVVYSNGRYIDLGEVNPGEIHIHLDIPESEERARRLIASGMKVLTVIIETEEIECPACSWGSEKRLVFEFAPSNIPLRHVLPCYECGFEIPLSPELVQLMEEMIRKPI